MRAGLAFRESSIRAGDVVDDDERLVVPIAHEPNFARRQNHGTRRARSAFIAQTNKRRLSMGLGKAGLFWLIGVPIPIIILLLLFWR